MNEILITLLAIFLVLIVLVFTARTRIKRIYTKYLTQGNSKNITGYALANYAKEKLELDQLSLATTDKHLNDAYMGKNKTLILSNAVCNYASLTSIAVTAHELGHALQDRQNNRLFGLITILNRITRFTNHFIMPLLLVGLGMYALGYFNILSAYYVTLGTNLSYTAFTLFLLQIAIKLTTIPLEYDASKKGYWFLKEYGLINKQEQRKIKHLLNTAALTYIASLFDGVILAGHRLFGLFSKKKEK